ncbi:MAG: LUD domain-containing protein [Archaeoglobaceae archaeon]
MDFERSITMYKSFKMLREKIEKEKEKYQDLCKEVRKIREESVCNQKLIDETVRNLRSRGFRVEIAEKCEDAIKLVLKEIGDEKIVIKSKSNVCKEIKLAENLIANGIEVIETDIGDRIMQIFGGEPAHPTGPAAHLSAERIAKKIKEIYGVEVEAKAESIAKFLKNEISKHIEKANVGISGANAITSDGLILLAHNEGNIAEVLRKRKWICITGIDKIYPSVYDALKAIKLQSFFATGKDSTSFIEIVSGAASTSDIEKKPVRIGGDALVILLDNGRSDIAKSNFREVLYCIGCGSCVTVCPMHLFNEYYKGGRFSLYYSLNGSDEVKLCLGCGKCVSACPLKIDIPSMIDLKEGSLKRFFYSHFVFTLLLIKFGLSYAQSKLRII